MPAAHGWFRGPLVRLADRPFVGHEPSEELSNHAHSHAVEGT